MPAALPAQMVEAILDAIQESGSVGVTSGGPRGNPREFTVTGPGERSLRLWVYIWTLKPGGRPEAMPDEYRIQPTGVRPPLAANPVPFPDGQTVLMGYYPDLGLFAGFDFQRHRRFGKSVSIQIRLYTLRQAMEDGLAFSRKENGEVAVAIRPDQFMTYVRNAHDLHQSGTDTRAFDLLARAASAPPRSADEQARLNAEIEALPASRRQVVQEIRRWSRDARFREQVLRAYARRCAVTGVELRLVEAAHILPVDAPGSLDHVRNGIALSPTYHRAYDSRLIFLDERYRMRLNDERVAALRARQLAHGLDQFAAPLGRRLLLPPDQNQWPDPALIRRANHFRRIRVP